MNAVELCGESWEEEGGIILTASDSRQGKQEFKFVKVLNSNRGTPVAVGLYVTDEQDFGKAVFPLLTGGWNMYASFHTHPTFSATPSSLDRENLFRGFKYNFIYSTLEKTISYSEWSPQNNLHTIYLHRNAFNYFIK